MPRDNRAKEEKQVQTQLMPSLYLDILIQATTMASATAPDGQDSRHHTREEISGVRRELHQPCLHA